MPDGVPDGVPDGDAARFGQDGERGSAAEGPLSAAPAAADPGGSVRAFGSGEPTGRALAGLGAAPATPTETAADSAARAGARPGCSGASSEAAAGDEPADEPADKAAATDPALDWARDGTFRAAMRRSGGVAWAAEAIRSPAGSPLRPLAGSGRAAGGQTDEGAYATVATGLVSGPVDAALDR
jgi:hypothetical protein